MNRSVRIPIYVNPSGASRQTTPAGAPVVTEAVPPVMDREATTLAGRPAERSHRSPAVAPTRPDSRPATPPPKPETQHETRSTEPGEEETLEMWRDRALRLQAEMENFRKRQQRLADERVAADRERLLQGFLDVADNLERALNADGADTESLRQGVGLTYQTLMRLLSQEGIEPVQAESQPFDPSWHEAIGTVSHQVAGARPDTVVEVVQAGYRLEDRLLRPARVIVAT
jgi:molecular chaperone GrpE